MLIKKGGNPDRLALEEEIRQLKKRDAHLNVIHHFTTELIKQQTVDDILWTITREAISLLNWEDCVVYQLDKTNQVLIQKAAHGPKNPIDLDIMNPIQIPVGQGIVGYVAQSGTPQLISDTTLDERYIIDDDIRLSELTVPILVDGEVFGVIDSEHPQKDFFTQDHLELIQSIARMTSPMIKTALYQQELELEVRMATQQLKEAVQKLESSNEELQQFAYVVSHDFRQPLRMISSYLGLIEQRYASVLDERGQEFINFAKGGATEMDGLILNLLDYARLDRQQFPFEDIDLNHVLQTVQFNLKVLIEQTSAVIQVDDLPIIKGHKSYLVLLFQNLLENAMKFRSEQPPRVQVTSTEMADAHHFSIKDNGIGIPADFRTHVFELFNKRHQRPGIAGTGMGLATCKRIVERHHGSIGFESIEGQGTRFNIILPK
ncbi:MAG: ATP-binding protein [Bacteroidota bacterium]